MACLNKKNLLMTWDVCVRTWPIHRERCHYFYTLSYKTVGVIQLWTFSKGNTVNGVFSHEKKYSSIFHASLFHLECGENIWKAFFWLFGRLSRQHNGTYRFQMWRCSMKQWGFLMFIPFKCAYGRSKKCLVYSIILELWSYILINMIT